MYIAVAEIDWRDICEIKIVFSCEKINNIYSGVAGHGLQLECKDIFDCSWKMKCLM